MEPFNPSMLKWKVEVDEYIQEGRKIAELADKSLEMKFNGKISFLADISNLQ